MTDDEIKIDRLRERLDFVERQLYRLYAVMLMPRELPGIEFDADLIDEMKRRAKQL